MAIRMGVSRGPCCEPELAAAVGDFLTFLYPFVRILSFQAFIPYPEFHVTRDNIHLLAPTALQRPRSRTDHVILLHLLQNEFPFP